MVSAQKNRFLSSLLLLTLLSSQTTWAQKTTIRGFVDALSTVENKKLSFGLGEQDLFITSELTDRISFLGESVFKFSSSSPTSFDVSIERIVIKYNLTGNHNLLIGKHHTPLNYWNDTYHHGRVFFPTIERPLLFGAEIIPLHTTGLSLQGQNLGSVKFGYDLMVGNGVGSGEIVDNDKSKSLTAAVHIKPADGLRFGLSYYNDVIAAGAKQHNGHVTNWKVNQNLYTASTAYFGKKFEFLAEGTLASNRTDTTGTKVTLASYAYAGVKIKDKLVPYIRVDNLHYEKGEIFYHTDNTTSFVGGVRYEINYLAVVKLEYQRTDSQLSGTFDKLTAQFAIGF
jgi:hypothetical protein